MSKIYDVQGNAFIFDETIKIPYQILPKVYITCADAGEDMSVLADNAKHNIEITYIDGEEKFTLYGTAKKQGAYTSIGSKKNLNITLFKDKPRTKKQKISFGSWYPMSKFHIKGNRSDYSMVRNSVLSRLAYRFCGGLNLPNGAWGYIDSFPIILYWNGNFYGCYTWNLPQDEHLFNLEDNNEDHMAFRTDLGNDGLYSITSWEFRGDEDNLTSTMETAFQDLLDIMADTTNLTKAIVEAHFDINSLLSYILWLQIGYLNDNTANNWTLATWDGTIWYNVFYDLDIGFGFSNAGDISTSAYLSMNTFHTAVETLYADELKDVYANMRNAGLTGDLVADSLYAYQRRWGWENLKAEYDKWENDKPFKKGLNNVRTWTTARLAYLDTVYDYAE